MVRKKWGHGLGRGGKGEEMGTSVILSTIIIKEKVLYLLLTSSERPS